MTDSLARSKPISGLVRGLSALTSFVVSGFGFVVFLTAHAPERWGRFGHVTALAGADARQFGISIILLGLLPLMLWAKTPNGAAWLGATTAVMLLLNVFFGAGLWA
jgi:hypothetical protein